MTKMKGRGQIGCSQRLIKGTKDVFPQENACVTALQCKKKDGCGAWWMDVCVGIVDLSYEMKFLGSLIRRDRARSLWLQNSNYFYGAKNTPFIAIEKITGKWENSNKYNACFNFDDYGL